MAEVQQEVEPTVSVTFRDDVTGRNRMKIICAVNQEDKERLAEDSSGKSLTRFILNRVLHEFSVALATPLDGKADAEDRDAKKDA